MVLDGLVSQSSVVVVGVVLEVGGASFPDVPADRATVVMRVDAVLVRPDRYALAAGSLLTVEAKGFGLLRRGVTATVFAKPWLTGAGQAVQEVGHELHGGGLDDAGRRRIKAEVDAALERRREDLLRERVAASDLVLSGEVTEVRDAPREPGRLRISEHGPVWKEAVVRCQDGLKGAAAGEVVVVRFASSKDVMWKDTPHFELGQKSLFLLKLDRRSGGKALHAVVGAETKQVYAALTAGDVLSLKQWDKVKNVLKR